MIDLNISRGLSTDLFPNGELNPRILIEEGCWYLCTDTAELYLGVKTEKGLQLKQINGKNAVDVPTQVVPGSGTLEQKIIGARIDENTGILYFLFNDDTELEVGPVVGKDGADGKDGLTTAVKIGETSYEHVNGVIELPSFVTAEDLENRISNLDIPTVNLEDYAKKSEIPDVSGFIKEIPSEYITDSELTAKGYLTQHQDLSEYAKKTDLPDATIYAKKAELPDFGTFAHKSELPDMSVYLKEVPAEFITEAELANKGFITRQDLGDIADKNHTHPEYLTEQDISGKADVGHTHSEYLTEQSLEDYAKTSDLPDVSDFITAIPDEYITESELEAKGYLTEHQSLAEYAKKTELFSGSYADLNDKPEIPSIEGLASLDYVDKAIENVTIPEGSTQSTVYEHHIALTLVNGESNNRNAYNAANIAITSNFATPYTITSFKEF